MMRMLRRGWKRVVGSLRQREAGDAELTDEIESHIQLLAEENIRRGIAPEEAYRRAKLQFGSIESTKEGYRDQRGLPAFEVIAQDVRYAVRGIRRSPGFAI